MTLRHMALVMIGVGCACLVMTNLTGQSLPALIAKLVASTGFIVLAISSDALRSRYGRWILTGLLCSWAGDAFLELEAHGYFLPGLGSFLLAHVCYTVAFVTHGVRIRAMMATVIPVVLASGMVMFWLSPYVGAPMTPAVWAYVIVISVMVTFAWGARGAGGTWFMPIGATLFYLSDLSVATGQFVQPGFPNYVWGLPVYYIAQTMLAVSVARPFEVSPATVAEPARSTPETLHP
jgi:uncharacterized membrane protein YhhN